jgi:hypothetical protein
MLGVAAMAVTRRQLPRLAPGEREPGDRPQSEQELPTPEVPIHPGNGRPARRFAHFALLHGHVCDHPSLGKTGGVTPAKFRELALALPEATEEPHFDLSSFRVRGKIFATVPPGSPTVRIFVEAHTTHAMVATDPGTYAELRWGKKLSGLAVTLRTAKVGDVRELLEEAWRRKAPKSLLRELD